MRIPLDNPPGISNGFGVPDSNAAFGRHAGIDYPVATGTAVYACVSGQVSTVSNDKYHGNVVDIQNGSKWYRVMHLQKFVKTSGMVKEGELIAYSNNTGLSTGPHLHWDIRTQYNPSSFNAFINPLSLLNQGEDMGEIEALRSQLNTVTAIADGRYANFEAVVKALGANAPGKTEEERRDDAIAVAIDLLARVKAAEADAKLLAPGKYLVN